MAESTIGKEAKRGIVRIQDGSVKLRPVCHTFERRRDFGRFTPFVATLHEGITWMLRVTKRVLDEFDDVLLVLRHLPAIPSPERLLLQSFA